MAIYGFIALLVGFAGIVTSIVCLIVGQALSRRESFAVEAFNWAGHIASILSTIMLTFCCALLVYCFMTGDNTINYVAKYQSNSSSDIAWLFKLSGLWAGREGSLLFWAWLISLFNTIIAVRNLKKIEKLDNMALLVSQIVLAAFVGVLLFSESNMPFTAVAAEYLNSKGELVGMAKMWGMNSLLEHWAMAIHPPTLFIGYAGLTIPFAYAIAALIVNDSSRAWVDKSTRITIFSWLFLSFGIGLGAIWAYVVLGWGGYWGWDPVENASLLPWLVGVALIHSFTVYRQRGIFKRWSIICACIVFSFVILGTFITRSGLVDSVHAFEGDPVSLVLFLALIILSLLVGAIGSYIRWNSFSADSAGGDQFESVFTKEAAYYINNLLMVIAAFLLAYLTLSSALPEVLPFGGQKISAGTYNAIARPLGLLYLLILAVCPLLAWGRTDPKRFIKQARIPALLAFVMFISLMVFFVLELLPSYIAILDAGGTKAAELSDQGGIWYYNGLAVVGFLVASLLFFNSLFLLGRTIRGYAKSHNTNVFVATFGSLFNNASSFGGFLSHLSMAIILVGLIGSSMYVTEKTGYMAADLRTNEATEDFTIQDYVLKYEDNIIDQQDNETDVLYYLRLGVYKDGEYLGSVEPAVHVVTTTRQQTLVAAVMSFPSHDLFVVYQGVNDEGAYSLDVRINPLISWVWVGFGLLMIGIIISTIGRRDPSRKKKAIKSSEGNESLIEVMNPVEDPFNPISSSNATSLAEESAEIEDKTEDTNKSLE